MSNTNYFIATVQVLGFDKNGTIFIKSNNFENAKAKLQNLAPAKDSDFVDFFDIAPFEANADDPEFIFAPPVELPATHYDIVNQLVDFYTETKHSN